MTDAEAETEAKRLLARYPYDPAINPAVYDVGSPERLRGVPAEMRESLARIYVRSFPRWVREADLELRRKFGKPEVMADDDAGRRYP